MRKRIRSAQNGVSIFMLDDDPGIIDAISYKVGKHGFTCSGTTSTCTFINELKTSRNKYDIAIVDYFLDGTMDGSKVTEEIRKFDKQIAIILLTGYSGKVNGFEALKLMDIDFYCEKSNSFDSLMITLEECKKMISRVRLLTGDEFNFGSNLRKLRHSKNMTQAELANFLGLKRETITYYESNKNEPNLENLKRIASYFNVSVDSLLSNRI